MLSKQHLLLHVPKRAIAHDRFESLIVHLPRMDAAEPQSIFPLFMCYFICYEGLHIVFRWWLRQSRTAGAIIPLASLPYSLRVPFVKMADLRGMYCFTQTTHTHKHTHTHTQTHTKEAISVRKSAKAPKGYTATPKNCENTTLYWQLTEQNTKKSVFCIFQTPCF